MRRPLVPIALLTVLTSLGCSTWVHSGKNRQEWYSDFRACNEDATLIADYASGYVKGGIGIEFRLYPKVRPTLFRPFGKRIRENCMQDRGWTRDETPDEAPASN